MLKHKAVLSLLLIAWLARADDPGGVEVAKPATQGSASGASPSSECGQEDRRCQTDQRAFDVMSRLHDLLDDDKNGAVDAAEVHDFARVELDYAADFERTEALNRGDPSVSTKELWHLWRTSEPYNWTVEDVCQWADQHAGLPQLAEALREFAIDGAHLPLLTEPTHHPAAAQAVRGLTATQRRKLAIKAIDVVLFGPPKKAHSLLKDALLALFLVITAGGVWLGLVQRRFFEDHRRKVWEQLEHLKTAEQSLVDLQQKLNSAERRSEKVRLEKLRLEELYKQEICSLKERASQLSADRRKRCSPIAQPSSASGEPASGEEDPEGLRDQLEQAEREIGQLRCLLEESARLQQLQDLPAGGSAAAAAELQHLLQTSYEMELRYCSGSKAKAEEQLRKASEGLRKLSRKRTGILSSFRLSHSGSIDSLETAIALASWTD